MVLHGTGRYSSCYQRKNVNTNSATNSDFPVSVFQLHFEHDGELNDHPPHPVGSPPQDSYVFLPPEFLLLRNYIHLSHTDLLFTESIDKKEIKDKSNTEELKGGSVIFLHLHGSV